MLEKIAKTSTQVASLPKTIVLAVDAAIGTVVYTVPEGKVFNGVITSNGNLSYSFGIKVKGSTAVTYSNRTGGTNVAADSLSIELHTGDSIVANGTAAGKACLVIGKEV